MSTHNKTRAEKRASGLAELSVWISPDERDAIRSEAERLNVSVAYLVAEWAKKLAKTLARRNRQSSAPQSTRAAPTAP